VLCIGASALAGGDRAGLFVLLFSLVFGAIGCADDLVKIKKKHNEGLTASQKFLLQLAAAVAFISLLRYSGYLSPDLYVPFLNISLHLSWWLYTVFAAFAVVATVNAVNITDGIDGLAAGVTIPVAVFYAAASLLWGRTSLCIFASGLAGGLAGFLVYNFHPAKVFMGDTGSLFLGGAVCGLAFALDMPLIILVVGVIYVAEVLSDVIQMAYFKATHGRRIFRMAPLHHHFEMGGWSEKKLFFVFSGITAVMCALAYLGVAGRYPY
ncbi:MAG TPA: phospho-N-acetylmuramoyl-pentapeptide-transferase, partial [Oscillospiraceae bacterium]|nr:phospho-N-acetylmuramoyl-pentapeptide-transferase [Oscillospiraceae bacterium]